MSWADISVSLAKGKDWTGPVALGKAKFSNPRSTGEEKQEKQKDSDKKEIYGGGENKKYIRQKVYLWQGP